MNLKALAVSILFVAFVSYLGEEASGQQSSPGTNIKYRSPIRYVVVYDRVDPSLGPEDSESRFVEVLIDNKNFSEKSIKRLAGLICTRFAVPTVMYINIYTNLEDVQTPEERDEVLLAHGRSAGPTPSNRATIVRRAGGTKLLRMIWRSGEARTSQFK